MFVDEIDGQLVFAEEPEGWLLLQGGNGCGKTHLAAAIANRALNRGRRVFFAAVPELLDHLRSTFSPAREIQRDEIFELVVATALGQSTRQLDAALAALDAATADTTSEGGLA